MAVKIEQLEAQVEELKKELSTWKTISETHGETLKETEDELSQATKLIKRLVGQLKVNNAFARGNIALWNVHLIRDSEAFLKDRP